MSEEHETTDNEAEIMTMLRARDWARERVDPAVIAREGLSKFHVAHALMAESIMLMVNCDVETSRTFAMTFTQQLIEFGKAGLAEQSATTQAARVALRVIE
jgi:hypothetical protein